MGLWQIAPIELSLAIFALSKIDNGTELQTLKYRNSRIFTRFFGALSFPAVEQAFAAKALAGSFTLELPLCKPPSHHS
jgi:hypothetical protein